MLRCGSGISEYRTLRTRAGCARIQLGSQDIALAPYAHRLYNLCFNGREAQNRSTLEVRPENLRSIERDRGNCMRFVPEFNLDRLDLAFLCTNYAIDLEIKAPSVARKNGSA
jgi:hypothetical protein